MCGSYLVSQSPKVAAALVAPSAIATDAILDFVEAKLLPHTCSFLATAPDAKSGPALLASLEASLAVVESQFLPQRVGSSLTDAALLPSLYVLFGPQGRLQEARSRYPQICAYVTQASAHYAGVLKASGWLPSLPAGAFSWLLVVRLGVPVLAAALLVRIITVLG